MAFATIWLNFAMIGKVNHPWRQREQQFLEPPFERITVKKIGRLRKPP